MTVIPVQARSGLRLLVISLLLAAFSASAQNCTKPVGTSITIPDGESASQDEMVASQQAVSAYVEQIYAYLNCLDERSAKLPEDESGDRARAINDARYNAALDEMSRLTERFNTQVRVYRIRQERPR